MNAKIARAWSGVRAKATNSPAGGTSRKDEANSETSRRSFCLEDSSSSSGTESKRFTCFLLMGRTLSSSSNTKQRAQSANDRMKRSLKRGTKSALEWAPLPRNRAWTSIVCAYSCLRLLTVLNNNTTSPPPSTVSIVLASKLGVNASKSCNTRQP